MSEMIERVARAMSLIYDGVDIWDVKSEHGSHDYVGKEDFRGMARAAIEAMREPTQDMVKLGSQAGPWTSDRYRAMIDAALEAKP